MPSAAEAPVTAAANRPSRLAASVADLLLEVSPEGLILSVSPSVTPLAGYDAADVVGRQALDLVLPADRRRLLRHFLRVMRHGPRVSRPMAFGALAKDGRTLWFEGNPGPLLDPVSGQIHGWVDVLRDVGFRKDREAALAAALHAAEAGAAARADVLANMSHEIRTPLNSIIGFMQVLKRDGSLGDAQLDHIARVEQASRDLLIVVDDVLDLSKIESGAIRLNERAFSPAALVDDAAALIRPQAAEKHLPVVLDIAAAAAAMVVGDPDRLRQVLLNLLSNAVKFTVKGEVRLRLEAHRLDQALDLAFIVEDSGMGIAPEQISKLFRRYTQADGTIARRFGGTGLGLAISKRLIEAMGGSIDVASGLAEGSRFAARLRLPLAGPPAATPARAVPRRRATALSRDALRGLRLLVAEDVPVNQRLVEAMLDPLGCAMDFVADGAEALQAVQRQDYALVLMDMRMPVLDGGAAARAIRALGGRMATLPIIALTANVFPEDAEQAKAAGMNDIVTKPIKAEHLLGTVIKWANRRPRRLSSPS